MGLLRKMIGAFRGSGTADKSAPRAARIEALGFRLVDLRGWHEGQYAARRYFLEKEGETVAGPFHSSEDAYQAAKRMVKGVPEPVPQIEEQQTSQAGF